MENTTSPYPMAPTEQEVDRARAQYQQLRRELVALRMSAVPDASAIDSMMERFRDAQMDFKAKFGLRGNNPNE